MIRFDDNELEIALVTYNRCDFVKEWIEICYSELVARNIVLSIYDSSTDSNTRNLVQSYNCDANKNITYHKIDSDTEIGYKPMLPILNSKAKYVWVSGDSRYHNFEELDEKVFPYIKQGLDYILIRIASNQENDGKIYSNHGEFLRECFLSTTCIGLSIYKRELFDLLKENTDWMVECDKKYRHNYGFGWLGYFYEALACRDFKAAFSVIEILDILPEVKKQVWVRRFYECWVENVCELIDYLPEKYEGKNNIPHETWNTMNFDSMVYCYRARISGGLNREIFNKYYDNGMLQRVTNKIGRIRFFAIAPEWLLSIGRLIRKVIIELKRILKLNS